MNPTKRLIVTGANGFVAGSVIMHAGPEWELHAISRGPALTERPGLHWHTLADTGDPAALRALFNEVRPQALIHTAAIADIDYCQAHPDLARKVNVDLTRTLAHLCAEYATKLVHCSTDTVFGGERAPYRESDPPEPINFYAETKVAAEEIVGTMTTPAVIARLALVMGLPLLGAGNSFLSKMRAAFQQGREVGVPAVEVRTPVDVITLGLALLELAGSDHTGIYHLSGCDSLNRFDITRRIATRLGFPESLVVANDPTGIPGRAPRPRDVSLDNAKARADLKTPMCSLDQGLTLILNTEERSSS